MSTSNIYVRKQWKMISTSESFNKSKNLGDIIVSLLRADGLSVVKNVVAIFFP